MNRSRLAGYFVLILTLGGTAMAVDARDDELAGLQWKNRVLVVIAQSPQDDRLALQRRIFQQSRPGMSERQMVLVEAIGDDERARGIRKRFSVGVDQFKVLLLGKDGNTALTSAQPLTAEKLFGTIDAMPMRKDEMRREGN